MENVRRAVAILIAFVFVGFGSGAISAPAAAGAAEMETSGPEPWRQMAYKMELIEMRATDAFAAGFEAPPAADEGEWRVLDAPPVVRLEREGRLSSSGEVLREGAATRRTSTAWLVAAMGESAGMRIVREKTALLHDGRSVSTSVDGLALRVTPLRFDEAMRRVLSAVRVDTVAGRSQFETEVWVVDGEPKLVAVLEQSETFENRRTSSKAVRAESRYYALYVSVHRVAADTSLPVVTAGHVHGFAPPGKMTTPPEAGHGSFVELGIHPGASSAGAGLRMAWVQRLGDGPRFKLDVSHLERGARHEFALKMPVLEDERSLLKLGLHFIHVPHIDAALGAVSISERLRFGPLWAVDVGYAPVVHTLTGGVSQKPLWWVTVAYGEHPSWTLTYRSGPRVGAKDALRLRWNVPVRPGWALQIGHDVELGRRHEGWSVGLHWRLGK